MPPGADSQGNAIRVPRGEGAAGRVLEPTAEEVEALIRAIPYGETRTVKDLRLDLADERSVAAVCAVTTGLHLRRIPTAAPDSIAPGAPLDTAIPLWRVVRGTTRLLPTSPHPPHPVRP